MILKIFKGLIPDLILTFIATSCTSTSKAPENKSNEAKTFKAPDDKGTVYLYRTGRAMGAAGQLMVQVKSIDKLGNEGIKEIIFYTID